MRSWKFFTSKVRIWTISPKKKLHVPDLNEGEKDIELKRANVRVREFRTTPSKHLRNLEDVMRE